MEKHSESRLSYLFAHLPLLSSNLSLLSASSLLCVSTVHIVGSLASKLPSNMVISPAESGFLPWSKSLLHLGIGSLTQIKTVAIANFIPGEFST